MADNEQFKYDPEEEAKAKKTRLPFALCNAYGIHVQDWWQPRHAWAALQDRGYIDDVSDEYADYYRELKKKKSEESRQRASIKRKQLSDKRHNPDAAYVHEDGKIAGAEMGTPMTFEEANSGHCNPYYGTEQIGYKTNCQTCVATYYARRMGYDVRALPNLDNKAVFELSHQTSLAYVDENGNHPKKVSIDRKDEIGQNLAAGEIGAVQWGWRGKRSGHIIIAEKIEDGSVRLYDPQVNRIYEDLPYGATRIEFTKLSGYAIDESFADKIMKKGGNRE